MTISDIIMSKSRPASNKWRHPQTGVTRTLVRTERGRVFYQADSVPGKTLQVTEHDWQRWVKEAEVVCG